MIKDKYKILLDYQVLPGVGVEQLRFFKDHRPEEFCICGIMLRAVNGLNGTIKYPPSYYTLSDMDELFFGYNNGAFLTIFINSKVGVIVPVDRILAAEQSLPKYCVPIKPYMLRPVWLIVKEEDQFEVRIDWPQPIPHKKWRQGGSWGEVWELYIELNLCVINPKYLDKNRIKEKP